MRPIDADVLTEILTTAIRNMESLAKFIGCEDDPEIKMEIRTYRDILNGVKEQPTIEPERKKGKWIPCSERLPEDDTEVFVYLFDRPSPYIAWVTDSCWFTEEFQVEKENYPKAWMPLPEPYGAERRTE